MNKDDKTKLKNEYFQFSRNWYYSTISENIRKISQSQIGYEFFLPLSYQVPIEDQFGLTAHIDGTTFHFKFLHKPYNPFQFYEEFFGEKDLGVRTNIHCFIGLTEDINEDGLFDKFYFAVGTLNRILQGIRAVTEDLDIQNIMDSNLPAFVPYQTFELTAEKTHELGVLLTIDNVPAPKKGIGIEYKEILTRRMNEAIMDTNPFMLSLNYLFDAKRHYRIGFLRHAALDLQTSMELFFRQTYKILAKESYVKNLKFHHLFTTHFPKLIGLKNFPIDEGISEPGKYWNNVYLLRNKVAHEGYEPLLSEVETAISSAYEIRRWVLSKIKQKDLECFNLIAPLLEEYERI